MSRERPGVRRKRTEEGCQGLGFPQSGRMMSMRRHQMGPAKESRLRERRTKGWRAATWGAELGRSVPLVGEAGKDPKLQSQLG